MPDLITLGQSPLRLVVCITRASVTGYTLTFTDPDEKPSTITGALVLEVRDGPTWTATVEGNVATWTLDGEDTDVDWVTRRVQLVRIQGQTRDVIAAGWVVVDE